MDVVPLLPQRRAHGENDALPQQPVELDPADEKPAKVKPDPVLDFTIPEQRYQLTSVAEAGDRPLAIVRDRKTNKRHTLKLREKLHTFTVIRIEIEEPLLELQDADGKSVVLTKPPATTR